MKSINTIDLERGVCVIFGVRRCYISANIARDGIRAFFASVFASFLERIATTSRSLRPHNLRVYTHNVGVHSDTSILL